MLEKIEGREIMTCREAALKYSSKYYIMVITEVVDTQDNDLGYVLYTADKRRDLSAACLDEHKDAKLYFAFGTAVEPYPIVGNVVYYD